MERLTGQFSACNGFYLLATEHSCLLFYYCASTARDLIIARIGLSNVRSFRSRWLRQNFSVRPRGSRAGVVRWLVLGVFICARFTLRQVDVKTLKKNSVSRFVPRHRKNAKALIVSAAMRFVNLARLLGCFRAFSDFFLRKIERLLTLISAITLRRGSLPPSNAIVPIRPNTLARLCTQPYARHHCVQQPYATFSPAACRARSTRIVTVCAFSRCLICGFRSYLTYTEARNWKIFRPPPWKNVLT